MNKAELHYLSQPTLGCHTMSFLAPDSGTRGVHRPHLYQWAVCQWPRARGCGMRAIIVAILENLTCITPTFHPLRGTQSGLKKLKSDHGTPCRTVFSWLLTLFRIKFRFPQIKSTPNKTSGFISFVVPSAHPGFLSGLSSHQTVPALGPFHMHFLLPQKPWFFWSCLFLTL